MRQLEQQFPFKRSKTPGPIEKTKNVIYRQTIYNPIDHLWTFLGSFIGIGLIGYLNSLKF